MMQLNQTLERNKRLWFRSLGLAILFLFFVNTAQAGSLLATWDANTEDDLAGYKVYYGTESGNYTHIQDVGNQTSYLAENLKDGSTYHFAVSAYDLSGNESELSGEVSTVVALPSLAIHQNSNGIELTWSQVSGATQYNVYRSSEPYTLPTSPVETVVDPIYLDTNHTPNIVQQTYYTVRAVDGSGAPVYTFNPVAAFDVRLQRGLNLVSLPVAPSVTDVTSVMGENLAGGSNANVSDQVWFWKPQTQEYKVVWLAENTGTAVDGSWIDAASGSKSLREIESTEAFWVYVREEHRDTTITLTGQVPLQSETELSLTPGLNFVGSVYPVNVSLDSTELYIDQVVAGGNNSNVADLIMDWEGDQYDVAWLADGTGTSFDGKWMNESGSGLSTMQFQPGKGYIIWIKENQSNQTWTFPRPNVTE